MTRTLASRRAVVARAAASSRRMALALWLVSPFAHIAPQHARAQAEPGARPRIVVGEFEGPGAARVRKAVVRAFTRGHTYEPVPHERALGAAEVLDADLATSEGRAAVARELNIAWFIAGSVRRDGRRVVVELSGFDGQTGERVWTREFRGRRAPAVARAARRGVLQEVNRERPPVPAAKPESETGTGTGTETEPGAETEPGPEPDPSAAIAEPNPNRSADAPARAGADVASVLRDVEAAEAPERRARAPAFELGLAVRVLARDYTYENPEEELREHSWDPTPAAHVQLRWYPGAHFGDGLAAHLGIELEGQLMLPIEATRGISVFATEHRAAWAGLRGRIPLGASELGVHGGYGIHDVSIENSQFGGDPEVPSIAYRLLRAGLDARIALAPAFNLALRAAYLHPLAYGELGNRRWFPHTKGRGVEAEIGASYALAPALQLRASIGVVRHFLSFDPQPEDPSVSVLHRIAEGAIDQQASASLGLALQL